MKLIEINIKKENCLWLGDYVKRITNYVFEKSNQSIICVDKELYDVISMSPDFRFIKGEQNSGMLFDKEVFVNER